MWFRIRFVNTVQGLLWNVFMHWMCLLLLSTIEICLHLHLHEFILHWMHYKCLWGKDSIHWRDLPVSVFIHAFESNRNIDSMYCILKVLYREIRELMHIGGLMRGERLMVHHMQQVISFSQKLYLDYHAPSDFLLTASWRWAAFLEMLKYMDITSGPFMKTSHYLCWCL